MEMTKKKKKKALVLSLAMALLLPVTTFAQESRNTHGGMFGTNPSPAQKNTSLLNNGGISRSASSSNLGNQAFGGTHENLTNETFGETPIGSGIAILLLAGAGYVVFKKKED